MMELSLEAYRIIVNNVRSRVDLATLCLVSKGFRRVAERALYNTLFMHETERTERICKTLVSQPRVAELVEALTIAIEEGEERRGEGEAPAEEDEEEGGGGDDEATDTEENEAQSGVLEPDDQDESMELAVALALSLETGPHVKVPTTSSSARARLETEENLWPAISDALKKMSRLRHLSIVIDGSFSSPYSGRLAWILTDCPFRLKSFHSDMRWDENLVRFLNVQDEIEDLYIGDYDEGEEPGEVEESTGLDEKTPVTTMSSGPVGPRASHNSLTLSPTALPHLFTLECTFSEAAIAIVPGRPVSRLKTCFSRTDPEGKRAEMKVLFEGLGKALVPAKNRSSARGGRAVQEGLTGGSGRGGWYALDIADAEYEENFAMDLLRAVVNLTLVRSGSGGHGRAAGATKSTGSLSLKGTLRYLGTLVLPVGGRERLLFYGLLMQLRYLCCVELEISAWNPSPTVVGPVAFRALGNELRLYCPGVAKIVFVSMNAGEGEDIGERTTVEWITGEGVARVEREVMNGMSGTEGLWRDV
ncbi:uncharacterized protein C8R40DRAFT_1071860 [Lentinula edodes]|uniref:uncharacterized protein n=1 Tax=Lentinula edodes TaxID=5353 RepID=UPI001E8D69CF|nr:uncharacterized protein C8R40DRAFT_1071860 [Lentinula edodes]KAH7872380.1 hypothetical protein C8R40DRAFT_1071860 [Lentinula edodes]